MNLRKVSWDFKKAPFPAVMAVISFVLFAFIYYFVTVRSVKPYYFMGLIFAIPFASFGAITIFTVKEKLKRKVAVILTSVLTVIMPIVMGFAFIFMAIMASIDTVTDLNSYHRVLKLKDYENNELIKHFPSKIPSNAKDAIFNYQPGFLQGGEEYRLKFTTDVNTIESYTKELSQRAKWIGKSSNREAEINGVEMVSFDSFGYNKLPLDFTIYLIISEPYKPFDWNHGELSLVAVSKQRSEIIFFAEDW